MLVTMRSQMTHDQEATSTNMERRLAEMEKRMNKVALEMESL